MKFVRHFLLAAFALMSISTAAQAANLVRKVDSFDLLVDYSGSMMMTDKSVKDKKISIAKHVLTEVNNTIPELGYYASANTFAPYSQLAAYGQWNKAATAQALATLTDNHAIFGRLTPMGTGLQKLAPAYGQMKSPTAIVVATDGFSNYGADPVSEVKMLYQANPNLTLHIISLADTTEGQKILDQVAALKSNTVMVKATDLLNNPSNVAAFVREVFYDDMTEALVLRGVNFAFDSSALTNNAKDVLNEVAVLLKSESRSVIVEGWTDSVGTDAYNMGLSKRRAESVKAYLVKMGVLAGNLNAEGKGKSFKYNNATKEGAALNRRVEFVIQ